MLLLASCSETKYVAEGELLLDKVKVKRDVKERAVNTTELKSYVRQRGNSRLDEPYAAFDRRTTPDIRLVADNAVCDEPARTSAEYGLPPCYGGC